MTFDSLLASYLRSTPKPPSVQKAVAQWWPSFVAFCQAQELANPTALETRHLQRFQQSLTWEPQRGGRLYSANTVDLILRCTRDVFRWATTAGHLPHDPSRDLVLPRPMQPRPRNWSWDEVQAILKAPDRGQDIGLRDAVILALLTEANLEVRTLLELRIGEEARLDLETPTRELLALYCREPRSRWLRPETPSQFLFINSLGCKLGPQTVHDALQNAAERAGIAGPWSLKSLRRSYRAGLNRRLSSPSSLTETLN